MSEYDYADELGGDDELFADDSAFGVPYVPEAEPDVTAGFAPTLSGEQLAVAAASLASTPQAQQWFAEQQAAYVEAEREAVAPIIHSYLDSVEAKLDTTLDRRAVIEDAESIAEAFASSERVDSPEAALEVAEKALAIAARRNAGKETYDDIISRHVARVRR